jgi:hypothetical protein
MPQIKCPSNYVPLQQVTADNLNGHVNNATLQPGAVDSQTVLPTIAADDALLAYDKSALTLNKVEIGSLFTNNFPITSESITSSTINAAANNDVKVTPYSATAVTGSTYTSSNGITVVVSTLAVHNLAVNQIVEITGAGTGYNGTFKITAVTTNTFTYVLYTTATAGSGTLTYTRKGAEIVNGQLVVTGNEFLNGDLNVVGNTNISGSLKIAGKTPLAAEDSQSRIYVKTGSVTITTTGVENTVYTSPALTIPADETWIYQIQVFSRSGYVTGSTRPDVNNVRLRVYNNTTQIEEQYCSASPYGCHNTTWSYTKSLTSADNGFIFNVKIYNGITFIDAGGGTYQPVLYRVVLNKVKTSALSDNATCI